MKGYIDGNGRTGCLLINIELIKVGYPHINIKFMDRLAHYNAFDLFAGEMFIRASYEPVTHVEMDAAVCYYFGN